MIVRSLAVAALALAIVGATTSGLKAQEASPLFILKTSSKEPDTIVTAIRTYAQEKKWQYLGDNKIKQGQITLVKICVPEVGQALWAAGAHLSAMLPCGNIGIYKKGQDTEISVLHPRYMHQLYPSPETERASAIARPLLDALLEAVAK